MFQLLKLGHPANQDTFLAPQGVRIRGIPLYAHTHAHTATMGSQDHKALMRQEGKRGEKGALNQNERGKKELRGQVNHYIIIPIEFPCILIHITSSLLLIHITLSLLLIHITSSLTLSPGVSEEGSHPPRKPPRRTRHTQSTSVIIEEEPEETDLHSYNLFEEGYGLRSGSRTSREPSRSRGGSDETPSTLSLSQSEGVIDGRFSITSTEILPDFVRVEVCILYMVWLFPFEGDMG